MKFKKPISNKLQNNIQTQASSNNSIPFGLTDDQIRGSYNSLTEELQQVLIKYAIEKTGSATEAARFLGIARSTLHFKLKGEAP